MHYSSTSLIVAALLAAFACALAIILAMRDKHGGAQKPPAQKIYKVHVEGAKIFSEIDTTQIEQYARAQMQQSTVRAAEQLQGTLTKTVEQIAEHLSDLANNDLSQEFEKYRISLEALRNESIGEFNKLEKELEAKRNERLEQLDKQIAAEYTRRIDVFNSRLNDVVANYLVEALGENVDLGAQSSYIFSVLEKHKDDIKRDMLA